MLAFHPHSADQAVQTEAAAAGFYESPNGKKYARLQLLTIEGLLAGTQRAEHPDYEPDTGFKKAKPEKRGEQAGAAVNAPKSDPRSGSHLKIKTCAIHRVPA